MYVFICIELHLFCPSHDLLSIWEIWCFAISMDGLFSIQLVGYDRLAMFSPSSEKIMTLLKEVDIIRRNLLVKLKPVGCWLKSIYCCLNLRFCCSLVSSIRICCCFFISICYLNSHWLHHSGFLELGTSWIYWNIWTLQTNYIKIWRLGGGRVTIVTTVQRLPCPKVPIFGPKVPRTLLGGGCFVFYHGCWWWL
jgi:hypothetical protein